MYSADKYIILTILFAEISVWVETSLSYASLPMGPHNKMFKWTSHLSYFPQCSFFYDYIVAQKVTIDWVLEEYLFVIERRKQTATHQRFLSTPTCKQTHEHFSSAKFKKKQNFVVYSPSIYAYPHLKPAPESLNVISSWQYKWTEAQLFLPQDP